MSSTSRLDTQLKTPDSLRLFSPAKINLFLHITGRRADGYHNLQTVFRLLDWGDTLDFTLTNKSFERAIYPQATNRSMNDPHSTDKLNNNVSQDPADLVLPVTLHCAQSLTVNVRDNLIVKAALALLFWVNDNPDKLNEPLPRRLPIITIDLHKILPTGAGLGGGSSNAATTLIALNRLWKFTLTQSVLLDIAQSIGADVPIFIFGQDAIAEGIGEILTPIDLPHQHYLILNPKTHVATQALFGHPTLKRNASMLTPAQIISEKDSYIHNLHPPYCNVFEPPVTQMIVEVRNALDYLRGIESITHTTARMTGTGSSVFLPLSKAQIDSVNTYISQIEPPCPYIITASYKDDLL